MKKTYVVIPHWNRLTETVLMRGHKIDLHREIKHYENQLLQLCTARTAGPIQ